MKGQLYMYLSCWNVWKGGPGLALYTFDQETGELVFRKRINEENSFGCSCVDVKRKKLYVNNEITDFRNAPCQSGRIFVYDLDPETGDARERMRFTTECPNPAYVSLDPSGHYLFEAHHSLPEPLPIVRHVREEDGSIKRTYTYQEKCVMVYALDAEGDPEGIVDFVDHGDPEKWVESNPHSAVFSPSGKLIAVADKGTGYLYLYTFDEQKERLKLLSQTRTDVAGAHPRYVVFHPTKPYLYVNHEASLDGKCNVSAFRYEEDGAVQKINMVNALVRELPQDPDTRLEQQGLAMDPDGKYLYTVINSADVIGVMAIDQKSGALTAVDAVPVPGSWPRGVAVSPNGKYVLAACLGTGEIHVYAKGEDGGLQLVYTDPGMPGAAYLTFYQPD